MEKIRSGQPFLYREGGLNSTVIDIRMDHNVRGDLLIRALHTAVKRYPYLTDKLVEKDGIFYFEPCVMSMAVTKTDKFRVLGSMATGYHLLDVTYIGNSIRVAFHHALCDGRGIKPFIETLLYYYCCLKYNRKFDYTGIRLSDEPLLPGETQEPIGHVRRKCNESNLPQIEKDGFALPDNNENTTDYYRYEININQREFVMYAKDNGATPAVLLALLVSGSINRRYPDADKPVVCSMAVDFRKEAGCLNTHKNCVGSIYLPYSSDTAKLPFAEQAAQYRQMMREQKSSDAANSFLNMQVGLFEKLDQFNSLAEKQAMMAFFNDICINTYVVSYLGQIQLGDYAEHVEGIHLYNSGVKGLRINMIAAGEHITVDVLQNFESEDFISGFVKELSEAGFTYSMLDRIQFETTKDRTQITAGRQAERYYKLG